MIHPASTCDYEATLEEIRDNETVWVGRERLAEGKRLAGRSPRICVNHQRISLTDVSRLGRVRGQVMIAAGDAIFRAVEPGDLLYVTHTSQAAYGVSLLRDQELVVAIGAIAYVPLGESVRVARGPEEAWDSESVEETWLEVSSDGAAIRARTGDALAAGQYEVYVERTWQASPDGPDEQASIASRSIEGLPLAAMRSAIIIANTGTTYRQFGEEDIEAPVSGHRTWGRFGLRSLLRMK